MENRKLEEAAFGAGCFWGVEETFRRIPGVELTEAGFMGGKVKKPAYLLVCTGFTGHAETVHIRFDPKKVPYEKLLGVFWSSHDPTQVNRQGPDVGSQYRTVIFYYSDAQKKAAEKSKVELEQSKEFSKPIATQIVPATEFYRAEEYHQKYLQKRGQNVCQV